MIIKPKIRGFICSSSHPVGCAKNVEELIATVEHAGPLVRGPRRVLVIGSSTGYGLATRIVSAFGCGAATVGVFLEKPATGHRTATAGWYNTCAFDHCARAKGLYARHFNKDAHEGATKAAVCEAIAKDLGQVDLVVYSLAASRRTDAKTGKVFKSKLKSLTGSYSNKSYDVQRKEVVQLSVEKVSADDLEQTVAVMGGDDWRTWMDMLLEKNLMSSGAMAVAYSYVGPEISQSIYRQGTMGEAFRDLEHFAVEINTKMKAVHGKAFVSINKAVVTHASSSIPFCSLYLILLMKVMRLKGCHEGCIEQILRLFSDRLYIDSSLLHVPVDELGRIRLDEYELRADVQESVRLLWQSALTSNMNSHGEVDDYNREFYRLFGFGVEGVDYESDVEIDLPLDVS